jgi:hypothetical protein
VVPNRTALCETNVHAAEIVLEFIESRLRANYIRQLAVFLTVFSGLTAFAAEPALNLALLHGQYEETATRCIEKRGVVSDTCSPAIKDRLVIEQLSNDSARIIVHSHQINNHQCHADGIARLVDNKLKYCLDYEPGTCLLLAQKARKITLKVVLEGAAYVPFCGSRATLDGLEFSLDSKLDGKRCRTIQNATR